MRPSKKSFHLDAIDRVRGPRFVLMPGGWLPARVTALGGFTSVREHRLWHRGPYYTRWVDLGSMWSEYQWESRVPEDPWVQQVGVRGQEW